MRIPRPSWRRLKRRTGGVDRESVQWLFATCGVIASAIGVAQFLWPNGVAVINLWWVLGALVFGVLGGIVLRLVKRSIRAVSPSGRWTIEIVRGDLLSFKPIVITTDRRRNFELSKVSPASLMGQYIQSLDTQEQANLQKHIEQIMGDRLAQPGEVLDALGGSALLLACGRPTNGGTVTTWPHLSRTYDGLWQAVRAHQMDEVSVPVIGAGYSRVSLSHSAVLLALILSFHAASTERLVCNRLRVVISPEEFDQETMVLLRRFLAVLGYSYR